MLPMQKQFLVVQIVGVLALATPELEANVIWSENFDAATPGQAVTDPPLNWTSDGGTVAVGAMPHPGWQGNAIVGSLSVVSGSLIGGSAIRSLPAVPNADIIQFSFDAWAHTAAAGGGLIELFMDNGDYVGLQSWTNLNFRLDNVWIVYRYRRGASFARTEWVSDSKFMRDRTVHVMLTLDYDQQSFSTSFNDGTTTVTTPIFDFDASAAPSMVRVSELPRGRTLGVDYDNFRLAAVPEPGSWLLMACGLAALSLRARRFR